MPTPPMLPGDRRNYSFPDASDAGAFVFWITRRDPKSEPELDMLSGTELGWGASERIGAGGTSPPSGATRVRLTNVGKVPVHVELKSAKGEAAIQTPPPDGSVELTAPRGSGRKSAPIGMEPFQAGNRLLILPARTHNVFARLLSRPRRGDPGAGRVVDGKTGYDAIHGELLAEVDFDHDGPAGPGGRRLRYDVWNGMSNTPGAITVTMTTLPNPPRFGKPEAIRVVAGGEAAAASVPLEGVAAEARAVPPDDPDLEFSVELADGTLLAQVIAKEGSEVRDGIVLEAEAAGPDGTDMVRFPVEVVPPPLEWIGEADLGLVSANKPLRVKAAVDEVAGGTPPYKVEPGGYEGLERLGARVWITKEGITVGNLKRLPVGAVLSFAMVATDAAGETAKRTVLFRL